MFLLLELAESSFHTSLKTNRWNFYNKQNIINCSSIILLYQVLSTYNCITVKSKYFKASFFVQKRNISLNNKIFHLLQKKPSKRYNHKRNADSWICLMWQFFLTWAIYSTIMVNPYSEDFILTTSRILLYLKWVMKKNVLIYIYKITFDNYIYLKKKKIYHIIYRWNKYDVYIYIKRKYTFFIVCLNRKCSKTLIVLLNTVK